MTDQDFQFVAKLLRERSAVVLEPGKQYLVEARLTPIVHKLQLKSISELVARARAEPRNGLPTQIVEAMVTNETSFFRDVHPFESLRKTILPELIARRGTERTLNFWCAACSTGQEPYSLAIMLSEHFPQLANWRVRLIASDLSCEVLARAREGLYSQLEANRGLPATLLVKYFRQHANQWQVRDQVRQMIEFMEINLAAAWPALPAMDLILVRNVMIYFEADTKKTILGKVGRLLRPDGYLLLGGAETTFGLDDSFQRVEPLKAGFYQRRQA
jgi:chemotaxis protein methyltransferase CheR